MTDDGRWIEYHYIDELPPARRNPKNHNLPELRAAIDRFGFGEAPMIDERTGCLVAGHGRTEALTEMHAEGQAPPDGVRLGDAGRWQVPVQRGWSSRSDVEAEGYLVTSNQQTTLGGWNSPALFAVLADQPDLTGTGFTLADLEELNLGLPAVDPFADPQRDHDGEPADDEDDDEDPDDEEAAGSLLALAGVTVGEPDFPTATGQVWRLGDHHLVVAEVLTGWSAWRDLLVGDAVFVPYTSLLAPFTDRARHAPLVMVQPDKYLAGWVLTKWARITGRQPELVTRDAL